MMFVSTTVCQKRLNVYVYSISTFSNAAGPPRQPPFLPFTRECGVRLGSGQAPPAEVGPHIAQLISLLLAAHTWLVGWISQVVPLIGTC